MMNTKTNWITKSVVLISAILATYFLTLTLMLPRGSQVSNLDTHPQESIKQLEYLIERVDSHS